MEVVLAVVFAVVVVDLAEDVDLVDVEDVVEMEDLVLVVAAAVAGAPSNGVAMTRVPFTPAVE